MSRTDYHPFVPAPGTSRAAGKSPRPYTKEMLKRPGTQTFAARVKENREQTFKGITTDGTPIPGLFTLRPEDAPTDAILDAVAALIGRLTPAQKAATCLDINSTERRGWQNSEMLHENYGLRLDEVSPPVRDAVMAVLRASLGTQGYAKSRDVMRLNGFLGELVSGPDILGEWTFLFSISSEPSDTDPWGWQFFGHHLCLTCFIVGTQMTLTPTFMGAEPYYADQGPFDGVSVFEDEERFGLQLVRSLSAAQQREAILYHSVTGDELPPGRRHRNDGLHLGGAFQDNRVVPYEGIRGDNLSPAQAQSLLDLTECYLSTLPPGPLQAQMGDVERHMAETRFCWAGGTDETSVFYYRVQSPVVMIEFDHHSGVFLTNEQPEKFHVHTIVRTPNGNDYGMDLLRLHYETAPHHHHHE